MLQWIKKINQIILPIAFLVGCYAHTAHSVPNLPRRASVKIETGAAITFCSADSTECLTKRIMLGSGSGVVVSHYKDHSFSLSAGHVCNFPTKTPPLPKFNSPEEIYGLSQEMGLDLQFTPEKVVARWIMYVVDIDLNRHYTVPISVIVPNGLNESKTSVDLC